MRDKFLTNEYFDCRIKEEGEIFSLLENGGCRDQSMLAESMLGFIRLRYASISGIEELKITYNRFLEILYSSEKCFQKAMKTERPITLTNVRFVSSAIVFGECLGVSQSELTTMAKCIPAGKDQLVDRLLSHYQADRKISTDLTEKAKYKQLVAILDMEDKKQQAKKLKIYLDQWPNKLGIRAPDGVRPLHETPTYDGYWCYEAAAVVIVSDIDDESFKDHEFYPSELMSWRKE